MIVLKAEATVGVHDLSQKSNCVSSKKVELEQPLLSSSFFCFLNLDFLNGLKKFFNSPLGQFSGQKYSSLSCGQSPHYPLAKKLLTLNKLRALQ